MRFLAIPIVVLLAACAPSSGEVILSKNETKELITALCGVDPKMDESGNWYCPRPKEYPAIMAGEARADECGLHISEKAYTGSFTAQANQLLVSYIAECEPHSNNWGGSALFVRDENVFHLIRYYVGATYQDCAIAPSSSGQDSLYCLGTYMGQGVAVTSFGPLPLGLLQRRDEPWLQAISSSGFYGGEPALCALAPEYPTANDFLGLEIVKKRTSEGTVTLKASYVARATHEKACERYKSGKRIEPEKARQEVGSSDVVIISDDEISYGAMDVIFYPPDKTPHLKK